MKKRILLFLPTLLWAKGELGLALGEQWDSNLPQNTSDYDGWTTTPSAWLKQSQKLPMGFVLGASLKGNMEYLENRRDPLLNDPALQTGIWSEWKNKTISYKLNPSMALFLSPQRELVKRSLRTAQDLKYTFNQHKIALAVDFERNAYGDSLRNAWNWDLALAYQWNLENHWLEHFSLASGYNQNRAKSDTSSYDSKFVQMGAGWKFHKTSLDLDLERSWKDYQGLYADLRTADSIYQHNDYWNTKIGLAHNLWGYFILRTSLEYKWKESNIPLYSYQRWLAQFGVQWKYEW